MADKYLWSGATGAANGTSWANAYTTYNPIAVGAGDRIFVAHDHSELTTNPNPGSHSGTVSNPGKMICVNRLGTVPPVAADRRNTAVIATSGDVALNLSGCVHFDGINFVAGNATGNPNIQFSGPSLGYQRFDNCSFRIGSTGATGFINAFYNNGAYTEWNNCTVSFSNVGQRITWGGSGKLTWRNTPNALLGTIPTTLFVPSVSYSADIECIGVDLSAMGAGKTIFGSSPNEVNQSRLIDCKLDAAVTKTAAITGWANFVDFIRSGAAGINYGFFRQNVSGTLVEETSVVRTGGAGASDGTTPLSWKITTPATGVSFTKPFEAPPIAIWNDTVGSPVTATVEGVCPPGALPLDSECWLEAQYLSSSSSPIAGLVNDGTPNLLATPVAQSSSSATWTTTAASADPNISSVKLLLGFEAGMYDESPAARGAATVAAQAQTTTLNPKIGTSSLLLDGSGDYLTFPDSPDWDFGTGPFTIELFARFAATPTNGLLIAQWPGGGWALYFDTGKYFFRSALGDTTQYAFSPTLNQWYHFAMDRDASGVMRVYLDGAMISKNTYASNMGGSTNLLAIGSLTPGGFGTYDINGQLDEIRLSKGVARYGSDSGFTVPTAPFPRAPWTAFKLDVTFTPQQKGWIYARAKIGKASSIFYLDPKVTLS